MPRVLTVNVGLVRPMTIAGREVMTGYVKQPATGPVGVRPLGLAGDEQADPDVHGGLDKAVYAYPHEHYAFWNTVRAQAGLAPWGAETLPPGALGENLTLEGLLESGVWVGDVLRFPGCTLAVSAPRFPCFKFQAVMGFKQATRMMAQSGYCGFYLAVREPGQIAAGEPFELIPGPREVSIPELFAARMRREA
ncbi:MOSC domain-containing protein [Caldimonas brevitalea]|uniref:Sulfurase n=1 Tax=Caldimonas brevitalea TaxID=413882 RepID=A0A0G3BRU9_9BURK|nr:MOSC domain-containing protein [Caldimonas brevitalea]AKJ32154.1 sulfurase [Caldimonas brevitalea]